VQCVHARIGLQAQYDPRSYNYVTRLIIYTVMSECRLQNDAGRQSSTTSRMWLIKGRHIRTDVGGRYFVRLYQSCRDICRHTTLILQLYLAYIFKRIVNR